MNLSAVDVNEFIYLKDSAVVALDVIYITAREEPVSVPFVTTWSALERLRVFKDRLCTGRPLYQHSSGVGAVIQSLRHTIKIGVCEW
jgi:hypothetical protein